MSDIYDKFSKKQTTIAITVEENRNEEKNLPCFTVCPWNIFKNYGFHYKLRDFAMNSYEINEIFLDNKESNNSVQNGFIIQEVKNMILGRCYMFCRKAPAEKLTIYFVALRRNVDLKGIEIC
jgi:hypothetical protein